MSVAQPYHVLLIDDSEQILARLCENLHYACVKSQVRFRFIRANKQGRFVVTADSNGVITTDKNTGSLDNATFLSNQTRSNNYDFYFYTAYSPRQALPIISLAVIDRLTILSDIYMPSDVEVGILGLVEAISVRRLPVNLIFASSEYQNREMVQGLLRQGKAYFIEKGSQAWDGFSFALVTKATTFKYHYIVANDWRAHNLSAKITVSPSPSPVSLPPAKPAQSLPLPQSAPPPRVPSTSIDNLIKPAAALEKVTEKVPPKPVEEASVTATPNLRNRFLTGVLSLPQSLLKEGSKAAPAEEKNLRETMRSRMTKLLGRRKNTE